MYSSIEKVVLKTGEEVEAGVITGPDAEWRERILELLNHKGPIYQWQNAELLTGDVGVDVRFFILHRSGTPISHIMTTALQGVGILGHVWTRPDEREKGSASLLMDRVMQHFQENGGQTLFLGTGFDSHAYHIYRRRGFQSLEAGSGLMQFCVRPYPEFESEYFASGETEVVPLDWKHWPTLPALFMGDFSGVVRNVALKLHGRTLTEGPLLPVIQRERARREEGKPPQVMILQKPETGAAVGMASCLEDPLWRDHSIIDLYCHPNFWNEATVLLSQLPLPANKRILAYADVNCSPQCEAFFNSGFQTVATLPHWLPSNHCESGYTDVLLLEKR